MQIYIEYTWEKKYMKIYIILYTLVRVNVTRVICVGFMAFCRARIVLSRTCFLGDLLYLGVEGLLPYWEFFLVELLCRRCASFCLASSGWYFFTDWFPLYLPCWVFAYRRPGSSDLLRDLLESCFPCTCFLSGNDFLGNLLYIAFYEWAHYLYVIPRKVVWTV